MIIEGRVAYERSVLLGIRDYAARQPGWIMRLELPGRQVKRFLAGWRPDGILFQAAGLSPGALRAVTEADCPAIHVSDSRQTVAAPSVGLDNRIIGRLAAEHLWERGFRHFGFVGVRANGFSRTRFEAFAETLASTGYKVAAMELPATLPALDLPAERRLRQWLKRLPKPTALFAVHDECSLLVATLAREEGIRVPEDVAILGSDDDSLVCELASPKLSSIAVPARQVGRVAAERLDGYLAGKRRKRAVSAVLLPPEGVVTRQSTEVYRTPDETVNRVLRFIGAEFQRRLNVDEIVREMGVSRRALERKFRQHLGRSPLQELHRRRVEYARYLLTSGTDPLARIAERSGFADASQFVNVFRRQSGVTPGKYRRRAVPAGSTNASRD